MQVFVAFSFYRTTFCEKASVVQDVQHLTQTRPQMQRLNVETPSMPRSLRCLRKRSDSTGRGRFLSCLSLEFLLSRLKCPSQLEMQLLLHEICCWSQLLDGPSREATLKDCPSPSIVNVMCCGCAHFDLALAGPLVNVRFVGAGAAFGCFPGRLMFSGGGSPVVLNSYCMLLRLCQNLFTG